MPSLALLLCLFWFFSLFVFRSVLQWWRTGSTGLKGFHGRPGSLPWLAGAGFVVGVVLVLASPVAALAGWPGGALLFRVEALHALGAVLVVAGNVGALAAQMSMGASWRIGVDERETTPLVTSGLFGWMRNPIFGFIGLSLAGLVLLVPSAITLAAALTTLVAIEIQVRIVEEPYLVRTHGADYRDYAGRVGRFAPGIGRLRGSSDRARGRA
jgi:protein-S-isoprenylcysteine O-methyltransferase Ste14